jgi:hypothetical protein
VSVAALENIERIHGSVEELPGLQGINVKGEWGGLNLSRPKIDFKRLGV